MDDVLLMQITDSGDQLVTNFPHLVYRVWSALQLKIFFHIPAIQRLHQNVVFVLVRLLIDYVDKVFVFYDAWVTEIP